MAGGIALGEKVKYDHSCVELPEVRAALQNLLMDRESRVRYRALEAIGYNKTLVKYFQKHIEESINDANEATRELAKSLLRKHLGTIQEAQPRASKLRYIQLDPNIKVKDYMSTNIFDGAKVSLMYRVLDASGNNKVSGILHFPVIKVVKDITNELLRLQKLNKDVQYVIEVKVLSGQEESAFLIRKGSEIVLRPV